MAVLGGSLLPMVLPPLLVPVLAVEGGAGVENLEVVRVVRGVGGFSTNDVSVVLPKIRS